MSELPTASQLVKQQQQAEDLSAARDRVVEAAVYWESCEGLYRLEQLPKLSKAVRAYNTLTAKAKEASDG